MTTTINLTGTMINNRAHVVVPVLVPLSQLMAHLGRDATVASILGDLPIALRAEELFQVTGADLPSFPRPPAVVDDQTAMDTALYDMRAAKRLPSFMSAWDGEGEGGWGE